MKKRPILLNSWVDEYTLGAFCAKTNLIEYARTHLVWLRQRGNGRRRLFVQGIADEAQVSFADLSFEIARLRSRKPEAFDAAIREAAGDEVYLQICVALSDVADWESESQRRIGQDVANQGRRS